MRRSSRSKPVLRLSGTPNSPLDLSTTGAMARRSTRRPTTPANANTPGPETPGSVRRSARKKQEKSTQEAIRIQLEESSEEEPSPKQRKTARNRVSLLTREDIANFLDSTFEEEEEVEEEEEEEDEAPKKKNSKVEAAKSQGRGDRSSGRARAPSTAKNSSDELSENEKSRRLGRGRSQAKSTEKNKEENEGEEEGGGLRRSSRTPVPRTKMISESYTHSSKFYVAPSSTSPKKTEADSSRSLRARQTKTPVRVNKESSNEEEESPPPNKEVKAGSSRSLRQKQSNSKTPIKKSSEEETTPEAEVKARSSRNLRGRQTKTPVKRVQDERGKSIEKTTSPEVKAGTSRSLRVRQTKTPVKKTQGEEEPSTSTATRRTTRGKSQPKASPEQELTPVPTTPRSLRKRPMPAQEDSAASTSTPTSRPRNLNKGAGADSATSKPAEPKPAIASSSSSLQPKKVEWKFNVYGIPKCPLPCRESQFEEIWKFIFENVTEKNSGCMYVSGVPGTGKTVIVQAVVDTMQRINEEKKNLGFKYLYINGLTLASPDKLWKRMFKGLGLVSKSYGISSKEALKRLDSYFEGHGRIPIVLVVDELDQILDKQQSILYQLLEWSSHSKNMFSFLAIFNTMSLPEHGLAMRNNSRMGFKRAVFPPYSYEELQTIVLNMLSTFKTARLSSDCVSLLSRKVAAISGDARRALEIARRTLEIVESGEFSGMQAVSHAFKEIFSSAKIETIKHTSFLEQLVLKTICDEIRCSGVEEVLIAKIYDAVIPKAVYEGVMYNKDEIMKALLRLAVMRLVIIEDDHPSLHKRLLLKVPVEDVNFALGCHTELQSEN